MPNDWFADPLDNVTFGEDTTPSNHNDVDIHDLDDFDIEAANFIDSTHHENKENDISSAVDPFGYFDDIYKQKDHNNHFNTKPGHIGHGLTVNYIPEQFRVKRVRRKTSKFHRNLHRKNKH